MNKTEIFLEYKALLFSIAYNMLGSIENAEDLVQETYIKWMELENDEVKYIKAYLVKIITNKCINYLDSTRTKREKYVGVWLPEPFVNHEMDREHKLIDSYHALSIGVLSLLEKLSPQERAIFILREVFSYDYKELGEIFNKTEDNCRQIFKRAKDNLSGYDRRFEVNKEDHKKMLAGFIDAFSQGSVEELIKLFKEDIVLFADGGGKALPVSGVRITAALVPIHGRNNVANFIIGVSRKIFQYVPYLQREIVFVNGSPAIISYMGFVPFNLNAFAFEGEKIAAIYSISNPEKLKQFKRRIYD